MGNQIGYRSDIDGLRAIAVISVLIFHINEKWLPGGFVGVDIFFVISGFLITSQIIKQASTNNFTYADFYLRRVRRIAPALLTVLVATTIAAFALLKPEKISAFANSLALQSLALQNFVFLAEGDYFLGGASKPLLHTWSLAVEEQFYLFWPILIILFTRKLGKHAFAAVCALIAASFLLNILLINISPKSSFFLLPTRGWEMAIGGAAALQIENPYVKIIYKSKIGRHLSMAGTVMLIASLFFISQKMAFPGWVAIIPVAATALVLLGGSNGQGATYALLSLRPLTLIGLISYSLYLWHWPILVYAHEIKLDLTKFSQLAPLIGLMLAASYVSYALIEKPARQRKILKTPKQLLTAVGCCFLLLTAIGIHIRETNGAAYRYSENSRPYLTASFESQSNRCGIAFRALNPRAEVCPLQKGANGRKVLLWGNSHADMWSKMLTELAADKKASLYLNAKNCRPTRDSAFCNHAVQQSIIEAIKRDGYTDVVLAATWHDSYDIPNEVFEEEMISLVKQLPSDGLKIWFVIDPPKSNNFDPSVAYAKNPTTPSPGTLPMDDFESSMRSKAIELSSKLSALNSNVHVIDPTEAYCTEGTCRSGSNSEVWWRDANHLTNTGARRAKPFFERIFE